MEVNIFGLSDLSTILLIVASIILLIIISVLFIINNNLKKKVIIKERSTEKEVTLKTKMEDLKNSKVSMGKQIDSIDLFTRNYFAETFNLSRDLDYFEMADFFNKNNNKKAESYSEIMLETLYSGEKITKERINLILKLLEEIIEAEHPKLKQIPLKENELEKLPSSTMPEFKIKPEQPKLIKPESEKMPETEKLELKTLPELGNLQVLISNKNQNLNLIPSKIETLNKLNSLDEEQIRKAYKELQTQYKKTYIDAEKNKDDKTIFRLNKYREDVVKSVDEYAKDSKKIINLAQEISKGTKVISYLNNAKLF